MSDQRYNDGVDGIFRRGMESGRVRPPADLWDKINGELNQDRRRRRWGILWYATAASVAILATVGLFYFASLNDAGTVRFGEELALGSFVLPAGESAAQPDENGVKPFVKHNDGPAPFTPPPLPPQARVKRVNMNNPDMIVAPEMRDFNAPVSIAGLDPSFSPGHPGLRSAESLEWVPADREDEWIAEALREGKVFEFEDDDAASQKRGKGHWTLAGQFSPDVSVGSEALPASLFPAMPTSAMGKTVQPEAVANGYSTGLRVGYGLSDRVDLQTGINYASRVQIDQASITGLEEHTLEFRSRSEFLEVPVAARYKVIDGDDMDYYVNSGLSANFGVGLQGQIDNLDGETLYRSELERSWEPYQLNVMLGAGMEVKIADAIGVNVEPGVRARLLSKYDVPGARTSFSLRTGLNYHF